MSKEIVRDDEVLAVTIPAAGRMLGIGRGLAYEMAKEGKIPVIELGGRKVVPLARLKAMAA